MAIDYLAFDDENQSRLRDQITDAKKVLAADDIEDAITKHENAPILCTILPKGESEGPLVASKTNIDQREELKLIVVIVAESFRDKPDGTAGAYRLIQKVKAAMRSKDVEELTGRWAVRVRAVAVHDAARTSRLVSSRVSCDGRRGLPAGGLAHDRVC